MAAHRDETGGLKHGLALLVRALLLVGVPAVLTAIPFWLPWPGLDAFLADPRGTRITDRNGALLGVMPGQGGAFQIREDETEIPPACAELFVQMEDARFRRHPGVDPAAMARAIADRLLSREARSGASTITMQLARLVEPRAHSVPHKVAEVWRALRIESRLTKDRILAEYLNTLPFGRNTRGVGAASWTYFGADIATLSAAQLAVLAIVPRNPTRYDPFDHPQRLIAAASEASRRKHLGIDPREIEQAVRGARAGRPPTDAPHFTRYVAGLIAAGRLRTGSAGFRTGLDLGLNHDIEARVRFILSRYESARITNAAVVAIDNVTGEVIGWVGSRDFSDAARSGQIDGVLIRRQSASILKPFLYARAIEKGWTAATLLPDVPLVFGAVDQESYRPENFDKRSHGVVRLRTALASSLNVPAVYTLSRVGLADFLRTMRDLGFDLPADAGSRYGLGTAIGNAEVSLLDLVHAFTVFPRGGTVADLALQTGMYGESRRVFDPFSAWIVGNILSDPSARATGFGTRTYFRTGFPAMFKTGTSSEFTNLWCVGATPRYTVGAWAGNFDGRAVINKTGSIVPTQIVSDVLTRLSEEHPLPAAARDFKAGVRVVPARICTLTGRRATERCDSTRVEYFRGAAEVPAPCDYHAGPPGRRSLLDESFLGPGESVRILFPVMGQVFYLDETLREGLQGIPLAIAARQGQALAVTIDGARIPSGRDRSGLRVPLTRGSHLIVVTGAGASDRVFFEVR